MFAFDLGSHFSFFFPLKKDREGFALVVETVLGLEEIGI